VEPVGANYANKTVSFRVWWNAGSRDATHLSTVWVWVDYIKINSNNTTSGNTWTRAAVSAVSPTASISYDGSNRNGFWLQGNASTNYSATVTAQLSITETKFNWCAYASDYPPNVTGTASFIFKGTPPFIVKYSDGSTYSVSTKTGYTPVAGKFFASFSDKTGSSGCIASGGVSTFADFVPCPNSATGSTWTLTDTRDSKMYKVKYTPDLRYWMVQDLKYGGVPDNCASKTTFGWTTSAAIAASNRFGTNTYGDCRKEGVAGGGYYYDWAAVMQHPNAYRGSTDASFSSSGSVTGSNWRQGLCPAGWHVPTSNECTHAITVNGNNPNTYWFDANQFNWSKSGYVRKLDGLYNAGTTDSWLFTSTYQSAAYMYGFGGYKQTTMMLHFDTDVIDKTSGLNLRCVRNY
jgi:uncharacterized protein (TIGR02145 family)